MKMQKIVISKMAIDDLDGVYEIDRESFPVPWQKSSFEEELKNILATYLVAKLNDKIVGYIGMWFVIDECHITNIAVHPEFRHMGIAKKLVNGMIKLCNTHGISYILLEVRANNIPAQKLYESFGFKSDGIRKEYYKNPDGTYDDAILMTKEF
ncbi:ribosomal protein S18-alanine N-acetyltransferase [bacterium]|nr:ribosomal protein S18-alanine N-acetyltransferase [bacterium]